MTYKQRIVEVIVASILLIGLGMACKKNIDSFKQEDKERLIYNNVVVIGIDGAGAFFKDADTPCFDQFFQDGAITYRLQAVPPTSSAQGWGSMFYGVEPTVHGILNEVAEHIPYHNETLPSLFKIINEAMPQSESASIVAWPAINTGIIDCENEIYRFPLSGGQEISDLEIIDECDKYLGTHDPKMLFIQLDSVDKAGHKTGFGSEEYFSTIRDMDQLLARLFSILEKYMDMKKTLVIAISDHGGTPDGHHGGISQAERDAMFAIKGDSVIADKPIEDIEIRDVAPIILYALGLDSPQSFTGRIPVGVFEGVGGGERPIGTERNISHYYRAHQNSHTPPFPQDNLLLEKIIFRNSFDNLIQYGEKNESKEVLGYFGNAIDLNQSGWSTNTNSSNEWNSFSLSFWIKAAPTTEDPVIIADKNWSSGKNQGFVIAQTRNGILFNLADNNACRFDVKFSIPSDFYEGWTHYIFILDKCNKSVTCYCDFQKQFSEKISPEINIQECFGGGKITVGQDVTGKYSCSLSAWIDELIVFNDVLTEREIQQLKQYYTDFVVE